MWVPATYPVSWEAQKLHESEDSGWKQRQHLITTRTHNRGWFIRIQLKHSGRTPVVVSPPSHWKSTVCTHLFLKWNRQTSYVDFVFLYEFMLSIAHQIKRSNAHVDTASKMTVRTLEFSHVFHDNCHGLAFPSWEDDIWKIHWNLLKYDILLFQHIWLLLFVKGHSPSWVHTKLLTCKSDNCFVFSSLLWWSRLYSHPGTWALPSGAEPRHSTAPHAPLLLKSKWMSQVRWKQTP